MIQIEVQIIHVGAMLALCWLIIRSWALLRRLLGAIGPLLCVSRLLVGVLDRFFGVRDWSGLDLGGFGDHPGRFFELLNLIFRWFGVHTGLLFANALDMLKPRQNIGKTYVFPMFQAHHACRTQDKNRHKIVPGACRTELPTKIVLKTWLGTLRAPFWRGLGHS